VGEEGLPYYTTSVLDTPKFNCDCGEKVGSFLDVRLSRSGTCHTGFAINWPITTLWRPTRDLARTFLERVIAWRSERDTQHSTV